MNRLRKLLEISHEERTGRTAYVLRQETLPDPAPGFKWVEDSSFNAAETVLVNAALKEVFMSAIGTGYAIVDQTKAARKAAYERAASVYTVDIDGKPIVSFEATTHREAQELIKEDWFLRDLMVLVSEGQFLWDGKTSIRVRIATDAESACYREVAAESEEEGRDIVLAFLVTLDGMPRRQ
jgi:hypothetical protein